MKFKAIAIAMMLIASCKTTNAQTLGPINPGKPVWITNQGGGNKPCVGLMAPNTPYIVVNDNRGAYTLFDWDATAAGHLDMQDNDPLDVTTTTTTPPTLNKHGKVLVPGTTKTVTATSPATNLTIQVYVGDQTTGCDAKNANTNGCTLAGTEHYTMLPGTTMPYEWSVVQINPNGLEFEAIVVTAEVDRPATCTGNHYITTEHSNP